MRHITSMFRWLRDSRRLKGLRAKSARVEPLSEIEASQIPAGDFVSASFDADGRPIPSRMIVLLITPRTGSTYLCELLYRAGVCTAHEYFQREQYLPILAHRWGCIDRTRLSWPRYVRALERHRTSPEGMLGIQVSGAHLRRFAEALPHFSASDVRYLWLQRRDKLRQAVSLSIARQTGQWSSQFKARAKAKYDRSLILKALRAIHAEEDLIAAYLHAHAIPHETIYYEDVVRDPRGTVRSVLGVDIGATASNAVAVSRQGGPVNDAWVSRLGREMFFERESPKPASHRVPLPTKMERVAKV